MEILISSKILFFKSHKPLLLINTLEQQEMFVKHLCPTYENTLKICVHPPFLHKSARNHILRMEATVVLFYNVAIFIMGTCIDIRNISIVKR